MATTRMNPSANGPLHVGHAYMALVNAHYAHERLGRFYVRFDDEHAPSLEIMGRERTQRVARQMQVDLEWLGVGADEFLYESDMVCEAWREIAHRYPYEIPPQPPFYHHHQATPRWVGGHSQVYPYAPRLAAQKVMLDYMSGVDVLIRGEELLTEVSLYSYFCDEFGLPKPYFIYLPRLRAGSGEVSKSAGGHTLAEMRACGYTPAEVHETLAAACLQNPANGWGLDNIKERPCLPH